jgi:hypothetical protein
MKKIILTILIIGSWLINTPLVYGEAYSGVPSNLAAATVSDRELSLSWNYGGDNSNNIVIEVSKNVTPRIWVQVAKVPGDNRGYSHHDGLAPATTYVYRVKAIWYGNGGKEFSTQYSNEASATTYPLGEGWSGNASSVFNRTAPGDEITSAYAMAWNYVKRNGVWSDAASGGGSGSHSYSTSMYSCSLATSYRTTCNNSTCVIAPKLASKTGACTSNSTNQVVVPFNNGVYGDPDDAPEGNITSWIEKSTPCSGPGCSTSKVCVAEGIAESQSFSAGYTQSDESARITRTDNTIQYCPGTAPVCGIVNSVPKCQCGNNGGTDPGFYPTENPKIKDLIGEDIEIGFDEEYVRLKESGSGFTPELPVTPFDSFYAQLRFKLCSLAGVPAPNVTFKGQLIAINASGNNVVITEGDFIKYEESAVDVTYRLKFDLKNNISSDKLKVLLAAIGRDKMPYIKVVDPRTGASKRIDVEMDLCYHDSGKREGTHAIVVMKGETADLDEVGLLFKARSIEQALSNTDPFKKYFDKFSFYVDLGTYKDDSLVKRNLLPANVSMCGGRVGVARAYIYNHNTLEALSVLGQQTLEENSTTYDGQDVFLNTYKGNSVSRSMLPLIAVHEMGHVFGLSDEYLYHNESTSTQNYWIGKAGRDNCVADPENGYRSGANIYGETDHEGCSFERLYRPSAESIMKDEKASAKFNVVSCGIIIAGIKEMGKGSDYWQECTFLDTVKPSSYSASNLQNLQNTASPFGSGLINWFKSLFGFKPAVDTMSR